MKLKLKFEIAIVFAFLFFTISGFSQDPNFYIFLSFGQSNMEGQGVIEAQDKAVDSRFQVMEAVNCSNLGRTKGNWYTAVPPLCRCNTGLSPSDYFGRMMVANLSSNIKVGIINVSVAGCQIEMFDKYNYQSYLATSPDWLKNIANEYGGNPYQRLVDLAKLAQKAGVIKGILLHQGESNYGDNQWPSKVKGVYNNLISDLGLNPALVPLLAGQLVGGDNSGMNSSIIATLPQVLPNSYIISSNDCAAASDNLHFTSAGYRVLGSRYATKMLSLLGGSGCSPTSITPYIQTNGGAWQQTSSVSVSSGATVVIGPQPTSGGSWSWSGGGTSGTSRQQTIQPTSSTTATATYTNSCGATTSQVFTITVSGGTITGLVNNGVYVIEFKTDATKALDLLNGTDADGTAIRPWTKNGTTAQQWVAKDAGNGYWRFVSNASSSNRCIDLSGANTANGTKIQLWTNYSNDAQTWQVTDAGSGYYKLVSKLNTSRGFDVANCVVDGTQNLQLWDYYGTSCQLFKFNLITTKSAKVSDAENVTVVPVFKIYPNPSSNGIFNIILSGSDRESFSITIYSIDGKKVYETKNLSQGINEIHSGLKKGVYSIHLQSSKTKIGIEKLVID